MVWLSEQALRDAADPVIFFRGREYADEGLVDLAEVDKDHVSATVHGSVPYDVELANKRLLSWSCTCPYAEDGTCCKHVVATGLAVLGRDERPHLNSPSEEKVTDAGLRSWLADHQVSDLVDILMGAVDRLPGLRKELELRVAAEQGLAPDYRSYDAELAAAFDTDGFVRWRDIYDWSSGVEAALDRIGKLLGAGFANASVALAERGFAYLNDAYGHVDDSDGNLVFIAERLVDLHLAAIAAADVERASIAKQVLELSLASELDSIRDRLGDYHSVLGETGWQALREAAEDLWAEIPARHPGDEEPDRYGQRLRIVTVMESLAGDDLDTLLEIHARSLAHPYDWVRIIKLCAHNNRDDLAVEWGERGLEAFGDESNPQLIDALSDAYVRTGQLADSLALERRKFNSRPSTRDYARLRDRAKSSDCWPTERADARQVVREHVAAAERSTTAIQRRNAWWQPPGTLLVSILLDDGETEPAWTAAKTHGCSQNLWLQLAQLRAEDHPHDAIEVHRHRLDRDLEPARNDAYDAVVATLTTLAPLYERTEQANEFRKLVTEIRIGYKRRRNLLSRLDRAGL